MRSEIYIIGFILLITLFQVESSPGHNVHDYYKCNSDYARRNYRHCKEVDQESRNYGRVGRGIQNSYNHANNNNNINFLTVVASVVLGLSQYLRN